MHQLNACTEIGAAGQVQLHKPVFKIFNAEMSQSEEFSGEASVDFQAPRHSKFVTWSASRVAKRDKVHPFTIGIMNDNL